MKVAGEGDEQEFEVVHWDAASGVYWINEGMGFDWWFRHHGPEIPAPGLFIIENVRGEYIRGDGSTTDDSEEWSYDEPRPIVSALAEIARLRALNAKLVAACRATLDVEIGVLVEAPAEVLAALEAVGEAS